MNYDDEDFKKWLTDKGFYEIREKFCIQVLFDYEKDNFKELSYSTIHLIISGYEMTGSTYSQLISTNKIYQNIPKHIKLFAFSLSCYLKYMSNIDEMTMLELISIYILILSRFSRIKSKILNDYREIVKEFVTIETIGAN